MTAEWWPYSYDGCARAGNALERYVRTHILSRGTDLIPHEEWSRCRPWIEAALEYAGGTHTIEDVRQAIEAKRALLLAGRKSALVCEVQTFPRLKSFHVWLAGGDLAEIRSSQPQLEEYARRFGCRRISIAGRRGWVRAIEDLGYREKFTTVVKEIS